MVIFSNDGMYPASYYLGANEDTLYVVFDSIYTFQATGVFLLNPE